MSSNGVGDWWGSLATLGALAWLLVWSGCSEAKQKDGPRAPLSLTRTIPLPGVRASRPGVGIPGRLDHLAYDPATERLFVAALENNSLEVVDLTSGQRVESIPELPLAQGLACVPGASCVAVASGGDGLLHVFNTRTLEEKQKIEVGPEADNVRYDARNNTLLVSYGDTNRGAIAVFDALTWKKLRELPFPSRPESFQLNPVGRRIFANLPKGTKAVTDGEVAVANRENGQIMATIPLPGRARNFPMAYDAAHGRLFIASRRPARLIVIDVGTSAIVGEAPCTDDADDLFYDARTSQVLVIAGGFRPDLQEPGTASPCSPPGEMGAIDVFVVGAKGKLKHKATVPTAWHARTGLFVPARRALYLAVPMHGERDPEIREYTVEMPSLLEGMEPNPPGTVGRVASGVYATPTGQLLTPAGQQVELPGMRPQAIAISPDGKVVVTTGKKNTMAVIDTTTGRIRQVASLSTRPGEVNLEDELESEDPALAAANAPAPGRGPNRAPPPSNAKISFTGLVFSADGSRLFLSDPDGRIRIFPIGANHKVGRPVSHALPDIRRSGKDIPTGLAVSPDGQRLYIAGNVRDRLYEMDVDNGKVLRSWDTGVAPYEVALAADKVYVSNLGGRRAGTNDLAAPAGRGSKVRVDEVRALPTEGSVTVIDLVAGSVKTEILVDLHASAMALSPNKKYLVVANTGSDTLSVIDVKTDRVVEKIWARQTPADLFGAQPNALAFDRSGKWLFVCNGTQNAVASVKFEPEDNASKVVGLIPVGWFPAGIAYDAAHNRLCVANLKGIGALRSFQPDEPVKLASKDYFGTVSLAPVPSWFKRSSVTKIALRNMSYPRLAAARLPARPNQPPRPVPERVGEPSVFRHVIYVIKENRTYDQVLGDIAEGNGMTNLCTFGENYTPNQHKLAREFVLLDNTYCSGVQSADGHQWTDSALANEYIERQLTAGFPRSYPGAKVADAVDSLAWASSGFIWDNALAHGKSFRNYGEWMISEAGWKAKGHTNAISWRDYWSEFNTNTGAIRLRSRPGIATLRPFSNTNTVGWDLHVPDVMRAAEFIKELQQFEANGSLPEFVILFLPNDHTGGAKERYPAPGAQVADNDLALGRVVEAISHSKFWPETCLFAIEDDPQNGWDHVSGYRTTCYIASPYTKRRQTISTQYNQICLVRTMELILGLPPMNQMDATATAMTDCFTNESDLTPFLSVTNRVPLDTINPPPKKIANRVLRQDAIVSARLPLDEPDKCPEDVLNGILWRAMRGPDEPFPAWAVKAAEDKD
jgi:YVTN family beta-propeller protein